MGDVLTEYLKVAGEKVRELSKDEAARTYVGIGAIVVIVVVSYVGLKLLWFFLGLVKETYTGVMDLVFPFRHQEKVTLSAGRLAKLQGKEEKKEEVSKGKAKGKTEKKSSPPVAEKARPTPAKKVSKQQEVRTMYDTPRQRKNTPSTNFETVKGFRSASVVAFAPSPDVDLMFMGTDDRQYKLFRSSTLAKACESVPLRFDKATITFAQFDGPGRTLAVYVDNERSIKVYSVRFDQKSNLNLIWEHRVPPMALCGIGCGPGGGYAMLHEESGDVIVINRQGKEISRSQNKLGAIRQWRYSTQGNLLAVAGSMMNSARIWSIMSGNRSTLDDGPLWAGVTVEAYDHSTRAYYPAVVVAEDGSNTYTIKWNEGGLESFHIPRSELRPTGVQTKGESFNSMSHAMTLTGHKNSITCVGFSLDGTRAVSCSEDGGVRVWDIAVRWSQKEEPRLLASFVDTDYCYFTHCAISPNGKILVLGTPSTSLLVYRIDAKKAVLMGEISDAHPHDGQLKELAFTSKHVVMSMPDGHSKVCSPTPAPLYSSPQGCDVIHLYLKAMSLLTSWCG